MGGIREASIKIENPVDEWAFLDGVELKCAVAHGLINAKTVMDAVRNGTADYHFIEFMACPGGCLGGGGQPIPTNSRNQSKTCRGPFMRKMRDCQFGNRMIIRRLKKLYKDFLKEPLGEVSHHLLHTKYTKRERY